MPPSNSDIQVLLPTYNGVRFLLRQLDSLCGQTCSTFSLLTYDDASRDDSIALVDSYAGRLSIERIPNLSGKNIGAHKSFELLLTKATAPCIMFCDQDDVWNCDRIQKGAAALTGATASYGTVPIAVFSDLSLIDDDDYALPQTFLERAGSNPAAFADPYYLAFRNPAPGCSITINRELASVALPFTSAILMHDWWLLLTAAITGKIVFIDEPLIRYRLHQSNTLGIATDRPLPPVASILSLFRNNKLATIHHRSIAGLTQAEAIFAAHKKPFSRLHFWLAFITGRYLFPTLARRLPQFSRFSWKRL